MPISGVRKSTRAEGLSRAYQQPPRVIVRQPDPAANAYVLLLASILFSYRQKTYCSRKEREE